MDDNDRDLERMLALYRDVCVEAGIDALPDDEARESARRMLALARPAFEYHFRPAHGVPAVRSREVIRKRWDRAKFDGS